VQQPGIGLDRRHGGLQRRVARRRRSSPSRGGWEQAASHAHNCAAALVHFTVLTYWQASDKARLLARGSEVTSTRPITVHEALAAYTLDLRARSRNPGNANPTRFGLPPALLDKAVALLERNELLAWRNALAASRKPGTADRAMRMLRAALNLAAKGNPRITNAEAWRSLEALPDTWEANNVILPDDAVLRIVEAAYALDPAYGLLIETAAVTGQRASQLLRCVVADLQDGAAPRLMVPNSRKGRNRKAERKSVPITAGLATRLEKAAAGRSALAPLLTQSDGTTPWKEIDVALFRQCAVAAGVDPTVTPYCLRHSSITRQLLAARLPVWWQPCTIRVWQCSNGPTAASSLATRATR
jgi:integrase